MACRGFSARVFQDEEARADAIQRVDQPAVIDVDVVDLDGRRLALRDRVRVLIRLRDVVDELLDRVGIGEVNDPNAGVEIGEPGDLVFESVDVAVDGLSRLVRTESATLAATISSWPGHYQSSFAPPESVAGGPTALREPADLKEELRLVEDHIREVIKKQDAIGLHSITGGE